MTTSLKPDALVFNRQLVDQAAIDIGMSDWRLFEEVGGFALDIHRDGNRSTCRIIFSSIGTEVRTSRLSEGDRKSVRRSQSRVRVEG